MIEVYRFFDFVGGSTKLAHQIIIEFFQGPIDTKSITNQLYSIGVKSIPLILVVTASTGMVMAIQFGVGLEKFGGTMYIPKVVSLSIVRELGPVFACLMMAARVGAGIASEIGSMKVTQQIDAIRALGTSPIKKIVIPRVAAAALAIPLLSGIAIVTGILAALFICAIDLGISPSFFIQKVYSTIYLPDYLSGMGKTLFFAFFISIPSCYYGLNVSGGTQEVGAATTKAVVTSSILIMIGDFFLTKIFIFVGSWFS